MTATFASLLDAPLPKGNAEDGFNVLRAFTEPQPGAPVREHVILQAADATYSIRMGDWKFIERANAPEFESVRNKKKTEAAAKKKQKAGQRKDELYNLKQDPAETKNVIADNAELAAKMKKILNEARDRGYTRSGGAN
jgi:arylsulfatase A-like enzyme